ncbi:MAG TPA: hypothetical protein VKV74_08215 [Bryobacteraceae bacterium]|nr:hypothetical protein [Bryobacteraceae bacterium]
MAIAGAGMVAAGLGLSIAGAALIVPMVFGWAAGLLEKCSERFGDELESASRRIGTVAGTLRRSFHEVARPGASSVH